MPPPRESLAEMLRIERRGEHEFATPLEDFWGAPMGADVWARVALAAAQSCPDAELISLQGLLPAGLTLDTPLEIRIEPREAAGVAVRDLQLAQGGARGRALASFTTQSDGPAYQDFTPSETPPDPESLPSTVECARNEGWPEEYARGPIEFRRIGPMWRDPNRGDSYHHLAWLSPRVPFPAEPATDAAALVFAASWYPHWEFERRIGPKFAQGRFRSLDRALQIHQVEPWNDWWLLETRNEMARHGRALSTRRLFSRDGRLLASGFATALVATN